MQLDEILAVVFVALSLMIMVFGGAAFVTHAAQGLVTVEQQARHGGSPMGQTQLW